MQRIKVCILRTVVLRVVYKLFRIVRLSYGVMVALQFLVLSVVVRVRLGQQKAAVEVIRSLLFVGVCFVWLIVFGGYYAFFTCSHASLFLWAYMIFYQMKIQLFTYGYKKRGSAESQSLLTLNLIL